MNPSRGSRRFDLAAIALGVIATAIAAYLTIVHYEEGLLVCSVLSGCETVQASKYATIGPVPVALLGLGAALTMLALAIWRFTRPDLVFATTAAIFGIALTSLIYLFYLTYIELFVIDAICQWCVAFMVTTLVWFGLESWRLWRDLFAASGDLAEDDA